jgi:hypothetical protein
MNYKIVWTVIASLGVVTQVPGMLESHAFNRCFSFALERNLKGYGEDGPNASAYRYAYAQSYSQCGGGE